MAEFTRDEIMGVENTTEAIMRSADAVSAVGHAYHGLSEILLSILYELRVANERGRDA